MSKQSILVIDDEKSIRFSLNEALTLVGYDVILSDGEIDILDCISQKNPDLILLDMKLPDLNGMDLLKTVIQYDPEAIVMMITGYADIDSAVQAMKLGAYDYINKPFNIEELLINIAKALETRTLKKEIGNIRQCERRKYKMTSIIGESSVIQDLNRLVAKVAESKASTVLIQGDSGTGKSLVARVIHYASGRADKPFVEVNGTALPEALLESELFGHEKGAFTDAKKTKEGLFELADGGTLFLDEIGDMTPGMQSKLLHAIEEKSFRRVGGIKDIFVDIRIIAATNKNLEAAVKDGTFREDLYYRLKVMPIYVAPLREHKEDILEMAKFFIKEFNKQFKSNFLGLTDEAKQRLLFYAWPGNVRELKNVIERAMILGEDAFLSLDNLMLQRQPEIIAEGGRMDNQSQEEQLEDLSLDEIEKRHIQRVLRDTKWNRNKSAKILSINRTTLYNKIDKYNLEKNV